MNRIKPKTLAELEIRNNPGRVLNYLGALFDRLTIIRYAGHRRSVPFVECRCDCGENIITTLGSLLAGTCRSCGCLWREQCVTNLDGRTHCGSVDPELRRSYRIWKGMHSRCKNPNRRAYDHYGARGIRICDRWSGPCGFPNFIEDMGCAPDELTIERKDVNGDYSPENCTWISLQDQQRNGTNNWTVSVNGKCMSTGQAASILGIHHNIIGIYLRKYSSNKNECVPVESMLNHRYKPPRPMFQLNGITWTKLIG